MVVYDFQKKKTFWGFATMDVAANLYLATARALTDLRQYINSDLVFSNLKFWPLCSEIATVEVVIPTGLDPKLLLPSTRPLFQAEIHLKFSDLNWV